MPMKRGISNRTVSKNIKEMSAGPHHAKMARKLGAKKAHEMDVAAAMRMKNESMEMAIKPRPKMMMKM